MQTRGDLCENNKTKVRHMATGFACLSYHCLQIIKVSIDLLDLKQQWPKWELQPWLMEIHWGRSHSDQSSHYEPFLSKGERRRKHEMTSNITRLWFYTNSAFFFLNNLILYKTNITFYNQRQCFCDVHNLTSWLIIFTLL